MTTCPHIGSGRRKAVRDGDPLTPAVEVIDGIWHVRSFALVKEVLRAGTTTVQAGFNIDLARQGSQTVKDPILFMDGPEHRRQRSMIARYFAPATVSRRYRDLMESRADRLVAEIRAEFDAGRAVDLSGISMRYSVDVAAKVIGLTNSDTVGMARRLERLFAIPAIPPRSHVPPGDDPGDRRDADVESSVGDALAGHTTGDTTRDMAGDETEGVAGRRTPASLLAAAVSSVSSRVSTVTMSARSLAPLSLFYVRDVRPAIRARRRERDEDVISHLLDQDYGDAEILTECLTYGAAGMVTTREYISIVTWHLLEDAELRARYLGAEESERQEILHEILRLEPVVGHLYRRATSEITLEDGEVTHVVPAGAVLDLSVRAANADPEAVGEDPLGLCPGRDLSSGVRPEAMSFGDGNHRCPGNSLAIQETDILLTRLLALDPVLLGAPRLGWLDVVAGYELRQVMLAART